MLNCIVVNIIVKEGVLSYDRQYTGTTLFRGIINPKEYEILGPV